MVNVPKKRLPFLTLMMVGAVAGGWGGQRRFFADAMPSRRLGRSSRRSMMPIFPYDMLKTSVRTRHGNPSAIEAPLFVCCAVALFAIFIYRTSPNVEEIDYASVVFEGLLTMLPAIGLFSIAGLRRDHPRSFWLLFVGMSALTVSMTTDTLDEIVEVSGIYNTLFEGLFQVAGFGLLLLGLHSWLKWNDALNKQLNALATTDYLTGAANRRHFMVTLDDQIEQSRRYGRPLSLVLMDLDRFKNINDTFGHDAGDVELEKVSQIARHRTRRSDCFARYGGEEFVLLVPSTNLDGAWTIAESIRRAIESADHSSLPQVTASFGVAQYETNESRSDFLKRADQALYAAKQQGRNRVVSAPRQHAEMRSTG